MQRDTVTKMYVGRTKLIGGLQAAKSWTTGFLSMCCIHVSSKGWLLELDISWYVASTDTFKTHWFQQAVPLFVLNKA
jgi:hypothetical protein